MATGTALTAGEARDVLKTALPRLHDSDCHVVARRFDWPFKGEEDVCVIVARGKASAMLMNFVNDEVPPLNEASEQVPVSCESGDHDLTRRQAEAAGLSEAEGAPPFFR